MNAKVKDEFERLACALSPENLSCDGELSITEVRRRHRVFLKAWKGLEKKIGRKVSEDEVWLWIMAEHAVKRGG